MNSRLEGGQRVGDEGGSVRPFIRGSGISSVAPDKNSARGGGLIPAQMPQECPHLVPNSG